MFDVVLVAGVPVQVFDKLSKESGKRFAPNGRFISKPSVWEGYDREAETRFINEIYQYVISLPERAKVSVSLLYVDYENDSTRRFVEGFFPFALVRPVEPFRTTHCTTKQSANQQMNSYLALINEELDQLKQRRSIIKLHTEVHNLTPLLLPVRNFRNAAFHEMLRRLFESAGVCLELKAKLNEEIRLFFQRCPRVYPPTSGRAPRGQHCMSDGILYFASPGRDRHGHLRTRDAALHEQRCLLNARSRLGGWYDHSLHYDCEPVRGSLDRFYRNCHFSEVAPSAHHVNIAPNDYII